MKKIKNEIIIIKERTNAYESCEYCIGLKKKKKHVLNCYELHDYFGIKKKEKTACTHIFRTTLSIINLRRF